MMERASAMLRRALRAPSLLAGIAVALVAAAPLAAGLRYQGRDHTLSLLPTLCALRDPARRVLDPALGGGGPVLEDPQGMFFYPVAWLLRPFAPELAASLYVAVHLGLAAAFAARLAREMGGTRRGALAAGVSFALSGVVLDLVLHGPYLCAAAWLPLGWAGARSLARGPSAFGAAALALSLAMLCSGGDPQAAVVLGLVSFAELVGAAVRAWRRARGLGFLRAAAGFAVAGVAGAFLAAPQVLATVALRQAAARGQTTMVPPSTWSLDALGAFALAWPFSLTEDARGGASALAAYSGVTSSESLWSATPYVGLAILGAFVAGALSGLRRVPAVVTAVAAAMALGPSGGVLLVAFRALPPLALFRYPEKYLGIATLGACIVASAAWSVAHRAPRLRARLRIATALTAALSVSAMAWIFLRRNDIDAAAARVAIPLPGVGALPTLSTLVLRSGAVATAVAVLAAALAGSARRARWGVALLVADVALFALRVAPLHGPVASLPSPRDAFLPRGAMLCHASGGTTHFLVVPGYFEGGLRGVAMNRADLRPNIHQCVGVATPNLYYPSSQYASQRLAHGLLDAATDGGLQVARALGCTHLLVPGRAHPSLSLVSAPPTLTALYALPDAMPEASVARAPVLVSRLRETLRALRRGGGSAEAVRWLDDPQRADAIALPDGASVASASVAWTGSTAGTLRLAGNGGGVVVLRRPWWPGWTATQRGRPLRVLRAAGVQLAVVVPDASAGPVELRYRVAGLRTGAALATLGLLMLGAAAVWQRASRPRRRNET